MDRYYFTVPVKWTPETHPLGLGPDDLFAVEATDEVAARLQVIEHLGNNGEWCDTYTEAELADPDLAGYYPGRRVLFNPETFEVTDWSTTE